MKGSGIEKHNQIEQKGTMKQGKSFIEAYHEFRKSVDFTKVGILPEVNDLIWCMLMGIPYVPADEDDVEDVQIEAIDQRVAILKAVFVEVNKGQTDEFLDQGLSRYDQAGRMAKKLSVESN